MFYTKALQSLARRARWRMPEKGGPLVWIDCEMTGLDHTRDNILEISCLITDGRLNLLDKTGYETAIKSTQERLAQMDEWCTTTHKKTGLWDQCLKSETTAETADAQLLQYVQKYVPEPNLGVLAGNSVHVDRLFMLREFPKTISYLHYRIVDVSSIAEVGYRHNPKLMAQVPKKKYAHSARSDICESIAELKWFYDNYLRT